MHPLRFRKILAAIELGDTDSVTFRYAQALAHRSHAQLIILHAVDPVIYAFPHPSPIPAEPGSAGFAEVARMEEEARRHGIQLHSPVESELICERILQAVADHQADLLIVGTRVKSTAGHLAIGTVVRQLIGRCACPILTVPPEAAPEQFASRGWRNVLAATDFSESSLRALRAAHQLTTGLFTVLHVSPEGAGSMAQADLERLRLEAPFNESHTVPVDHLTATGDAVAYVTGCARDLRVDLLVLGAPSPISSPSELSSSTLLQIIGNVSCPVLCIPIPAEDHSSNGRLQMISA